MNVKRITIAVVAAAALPLAACGNSDEVDARQPESAAFVRPALGWPWVESGAGPAEADRSPLGWPWVEDDGPAGGKALIFRS